MTLSDLSAGEVAMWTRSSIRMLVSLVALGVAAASCANATEPDPDIAALAGTYWAGSPSSGSSAVGAFTTTESGVTTNQLQSGASIRLVLEASGRTTGRLLVPGEIDADLTGAWTLEDGRVGLSHGADTFLRDMDFIAGTGRLEAEQVFAGVTVHVVLQRVP